MDMRVFAKSPATDIETYKASMCYELAGKDFDFSMDGGEKLSLSFAAFPSREVRIGGSERGLEYYCGKISAKVLFISCAMKEACASYVLDLDSGLITRALTDMSGKTDVAFGAAGSAKERHGFTGDIDGNTVHWSLGPMDESTFKAVYDSGNVAVTRPRTGDAPVSGPSAYLAVKITKNIFFQNAALQVDGELKVVSLLTSFWNQTCVGSIYEISAGKGAGCRLISGYGRFVSE